ncbi:MAG TPA: lysophospholipid acyltransferase family protein [Chloroflexota bacterium]|nr:lysophospholipid acyltransferase family protein [Chloroflexota bacterium]
MVKVLAYRLLVGLVGWAPRAMAYAVARLAGTLYSFFPTKRRAGSRANLSVAMDLAIGDPQVWSASRAALRHWLLNFVDLLAVGRADFPALIQRAKVDHWERFNIAYGQGRGVVLVSAHVGPYDTLVQRLAVRGVPVLIPVEKLEPPAFLEFMRRRRGKLGMRLEPVGMGTFAAMSAFLKEGGVVVIVSDRDIQGNGEPAELFGRRVTLPTGALILALRTGAPLLGAFASRDQQGAISGYFTPEFTFGLEPGARDGGKLPARDLRPALRAGLRELASLLEREIRRDPSQWVVLQPMFSTPTRNAGVGASRPSMQAVGETAKGQPA